jgi:hypothetical protein
LWIQDRPRRGGEFAACTEERIGKFDFPYESQRLKEVSGHDLADPDTCFNRQLATRAWQTLLALRDQAAETPRRDGE